MLLDKGKIAGVWVKVSPKDTVPKAHRGPGRQSLSGRCRYQAAAGTLAMRSSSRSAVNRSSRSDSRRRSSSQDLAA